MVNRFVVPLLLFAAAALAALVCVRGVQLAGYGTGLAGTAGRVRDVQCVPTPTLGRGGGAKSCTGLFRPDGGTVADELPVSVSSAADHKGPQSASMEGGDGTVHLTGGLEAGRGIGLAVGAAGAFALALGGGLVRVSERARDLLDGRGLAGPASFALFAGGLLFLGMDLAA